MEKVCLLLLLTCISPSLVAGNLRHSGKLLQNTVLDPSSAGTDFAQAVDINASARKSEIFDQVLGKNYDPKIRPLGANGTGPLVIHVNMYLRNIENVNDIQMEFVSQVVFRQRWIDRRASYEHIQPNISYLQLALPNRIWTPDLFFENEKKAVLHQLIAPNTFTRVYPDGGILQSYRFTLHLSCPMDLHKYPLDVQKCPLRVSSYGWTTRNLILKWKENNTIQTNLEDFKMPQFRAVSYETEYCNTLTLTGEFSCLKLIIVFERNFGYYFIQIYIPCTMLVVVSWVAFFLEPTATEARVSLGVTTILTIVTQTYGINQSVPPSSYVKALDIWTATCQALIFGGLLQFAMVNYTARLANMPCQITGLEEMREEELEKVRVYGERKRKGIQKAKRLDLIARIGFPTIFLLFNITYWSSYLSSL